MGKLDVIEVWWTALGFGSFRILQSTRRTREPREQVSQPLNTCITVEAMEETHSRILSVAIRLENTPKLCLHVGPTDRARQ